MQEITLNDQLVESVYKVRGAITELITSVGADPRKSQELTRRFGIDKSLAWRISRVVKAPDAGAALPHLPGEAGLDIFLAAMQRAGAEKKVLAHAREATREFQRVVEHHLGDRPTLELVLDALPSQKTDRLAMSRKLAFRGNSGIWGMQARVRINTIIFAPNAEEPEMIDSIRLGGWVDFRRLRPDAQLTIFRRRAFRGGTSVSTGEVALDPDEPPDGPMLLRDFCSPSLPPITTTEDDGSFVYELGPSAVGNTGTFSMYFGAISRKLGSRFAENPGDTADFHAMIYAPVETLMFDMIVHHSLQFAMSPTLSVYGEVASDLWARKKRVVLPIEAERHQLGARPPVVATPLVKEYSNLIRHVFSRVGWNPDDFVGTRFNLDYPPFPATVGVSVPLEQRAAAV